MSYERGAQANIQFQLINSSNTPVTSGTTTGYVYADTAYLGTVSCTHIANGIWYGTIPSNYMDNDVVSVYISNSSAVPLTVNIKTTGSQTVRHVQLLSNYDFSLFTIGNLEYVADAENSTISVSSMTQRNGVSGNVLTVDTVAASNSGVSLKSRFNLYSGQVYRFGVWFYPTGSARTPRLRLVNSAGSAIQNIDGTSSTAGQWTYFTGVFVATDNYLNCKAIWTTSAAAAFTFYLDDIWLRGDVNLMTRDLIEVRTKTDGLNYSGANVLAAPGAGTITSASFASDATVPLVQNVVQPVQIIPTQDANTELLPTDRTGFEVELTGGDIVGGTLTAWGNLTSHGRTNALARSGSWCYSFVPAEANAGVRIFTFTPTIGKTYIFSYWARSVTNRHRTYSILWTGTTISFPIITLSNTSWTKVEYVWTATTSSSTIFIARGVESGGTFYIDDCSMTEATTNRDLDTKLTGVKTKTDQLTFTQTNRVDSQIAGINSGTIAAASIASNALPAAKFASDYWTTVGATPWSNASGTAVKAKTDQLTFTTPNVVDANATNNVAVTGTVTVGGFDTAGAGALRSNVSTAVNDLALSTQTSVNGIKSQTDKLQFNASNEVVTSLNTTDIVDAINNNLIYDGATVTFEELMQILHAYASGSITYSGGDDAKTFVYKDPNGSTVFSVTVSDDGRTRNS